MLVANTTLRTLRGGTRNACRCSLQGHRPGGCWVRQAGACIAPGHQGQHQPATGREDAASAEGMRPAQLGLHVEQVLPHCCPLAARTLGRLWSAGG
jgi:hypothetical protein